MKYPPRSAREIALNKSAADRAVDRRPHRNPLLEVERTVKSLQKFMQYVLSTALEWERDENQPVLTDSRMQFMSSGQLMGYLNELLIRVQHSGFIKTESIIREHGRRTAHRYLVHFHILGEINGRIKSARSIQKSILDSASNAIKQYGWDEAGKLLAERHTLQRRIKETRGAIDRLMLRAKLIMSDRKLPAQVEYRFGAEIFPETAPPRLMMIYDEFADGKRLEKYIYEMEQERAAAVADEADLARSISYMQRFLVKLGEQDYTPLDAYSSGFSVSGGQSGTPQGDN